MAKNKNPKPRHTKGANATARGTPASSTRPPSREKTAYVDITLAYRQAIERMIKEDPRFEDRSVPWIVQRLIMKFLADEGRLPKPEPHAPAD